VSRAARIGSIAAALALASGCSLINEPNRKLYMDAGADGAEIDAPPDGPTDALRDGMMDGGDGGCPDAGCPSPEECAGGEDDDLDGLVDCQDFDCVGFPDCCADDSVPDVVINEMWNGAIGLSWQGIPDDAAIPMTVDTHIERFREDDEPTALIRRECSPLLLGLELDVTFQVQGSPSCPDVGDCPYYAAMLLTAVRPEPSVPSPRRDRGDRQRARRHRRQPEPGRDRRHPPRPRVGRRARRQHRRRSRHRARHQRPRGCHDARDGDRT
jgi:hypothetical protein